MPFTANCLQKLMIIMLYANEPATMAIVTGNRNKTINDGYAMK
jgi:hypothetical protein